MTSKIAAATASFAFAAGLVAAAGSADARNRHHRHHYVAQKQGADDLAAPVETDYAWSRRTPIPYAYSFYPEEIEGGVSGNLPFNNQIRKSKDPLNANGGGG